MGGTAVWFLLGAWMMTFGIWEICHLMMTGFADKNLAREIAHAGHAGEGATPVATKTSLATSATAKASSCNHAAAEAVDNIIPVNEGGLGRLAWWCPTCETQLPADFAPPRSTAPLLMPHPDVWQHQRNEAVREAFAADLKTFSW